LVQAIIMAGGEGSRLRPMTCDKPKPMVPMLNRPVMEYAVELLKKHGINDIGVTLQYMPQEITDYFRDGSDHGINIRYFVEETPLGTAGSVKNAEDFLKDTFVVVSGDALTDFNLSEALDFHRKKGAVATLVLTPVEIPLEYGVVMTGQNGEIRQFLEKPGWGEVFSDTVNTGIYILEREVLEYVPQGQKYDFSKDLFPFLLKEGKPLFGISLQGYWCDIGNLSQYREAQFAAMEKKVDINLDLEDAQNRIYTGSNCQIDPTAVIEGPVFIGDNCRIGRNTIIGPYVVMGNRCIVDEGVSIRKSILWNGIYVGKQCELRGAVICDRVTVKDRAMVFEEAVIGNGSVLEENVKIRPGINIWPYKTVEKGSVVDTHLVWGDTACRNLFGLDGISGKVNINLTPECAAKLGAVYGTILGPDAVVLISSDYHRAPQMIKLAIQAGLMSVGISVIDGGSLISPAHRNSVRALKTDGGIHIKSSSSDPETVHINFFTGNGAMISRDQERKIENLFERNDFQRRPKQDAGYATYMPGLTEAYVQQILNMVDRNIIKDRRYRVAAWFTGDNMKETVPAVFGALGCETVNYGADFSPESPVEMMTAAKALAQEVTRLNANFGVVFDRNGEHVVLVDETGRLVDDNVFITLMSLIILETAEKPVVAVPVTGSSVIERLAGERQGRVIRTKTAPSVYLGEVMASETAGAQGRANQAVTVFDALSTVTRIMEYMAVRDTSLARIIDSFPELYMTRKETGCPWTAKGKVMRQLAEETGGNKVELIDGVKVYHDNGWALVLPDAEEPRYHVYSEGFSNEFAEELANFYIDRVNKLQE